MRNRIPIPRVEGFIPVPIPLPVQPLRKPSVPPTPGEILANRASALYYAGRTDDALVIAKQAVATERTTHTLNNLVVILETLGRPNQAFLPAKEAYELAPDDPRMARLYGESLLRRGYLALGWPIYAKTHESYEWLTPHVPEWRGEGLRGKRLLVFAVDGFGDSIYFLRWLVDLRDEGADVTYLVPPTLATLVRSTGIRAVENYNGNFDVDLASFDYHAQAHRVPQFVGASYDRPRGPFLRVRPSPRFHLRHRVGFCWRASERKDTPGREHDGASPWKLRSLNWDQRQRILAKLPAAYIDLANLSGSWLATASLLASLDLVVTVDTAIAHLAGALGVPVWVMLAGASQWHYPVHLNRHPFYPSMRMFFNRAEGLNRAVAALAEAL